MIQLRDYQTDSLEKLRSNLSRGVKAQVLQLATGGGKTAVASVVAQKAVEKGNRVFFIADSIELVEQAYGRFTQDGLSCGIIQGQHWLTDYAKPVQVATIQTLGKRWSRLSDDLMPKVVIIDECHVFHEAHKKIVAQCRNMGVAVIGLSATPFRKGLGQVFDDLVVGATTKTLTDQGYLVPARCYAPYVPDLKGVKMSGGDWQSDALGEFMSDAEIVGDVVDHWLRLAGGRQTIVFASNVAHSKFLQAAFAARGVRAGHIDGYERDPEVREQIINDYRNGNIQVLCNVAVLTKGFDAPETGCVVLARPTKSLMLHVQMIGRGLRIADGKTDCLILDHAGNVLRNGLPTDELPEILDDGTLAHDLDRREKSKDEPKSDPCSSCGFVSTKHKCPACGFAPERREDVEVINGELHEITEALGKPDQRNRKETKEQKAEFFGGLRYHAHQRGYSSGWVSHKYRERYGVWPNAFKNSPACPPNEQVKGFIKHLAIKNAKRKAAA